MYRPTTGQKCSCKRGVQRDNCPTCEGTGWIVDFRAIRDRMDKFDALDWALRRLGAATARHPHAELVEVLGQALLITRTGGAGSRRLAADLIEAAIKRISDDRGAK